MHASRQKVFDSVVNGQVIFIVRLESQFMRLLGPLSVHMATDCVVKHQKRLGVN